VTLVLIGLAVLGVCIVVGLASPTRRCARCHGERVTRSRWDGRLIGCPRCKGTGRGYRRGARLVSAALWGLRNAITTAREEKP
jgi:hypothetical protein